MYKNDAIRYLFAFVEIGKIFSQISLCRRRRQTDDERKWKYFNIEFGHM